VDIAQREGAVMDLEELNLSLPYRSTM